MEINEVIEENRRRLALRDAPDPRPKLPETFEDNFEFWARKCVTIRHKLSGEMIPFELNRPQRLLLEVMERQRREGLPIRVILLKARQWGGSTLIQMYMAWIQMVHKKNWNSIICAHVKEASASIRETYRNMLASYPESAWEDGVKPEFRAFGNSPNARVIPSRGCRVTLASAESQDSTRGADYSMAHLSEVAFWKSTAMRSPTDLVRAVCSGVPLRPYTLIALESTANGVGNYFHAEWLRAVKDPTSAFAPVFVPWYLVDHNELPVDDVADVWNNLDRYERDLWTASPAMTLGQIWWYHRKRAEYPDHASMMAEYPSTPTEAFVNTGSGVFSTEAVESFRPECSEPILRGDLVDVYGRCPEFRPDPVASLKIWKKPEFGREYIVAVDVGGRSLKSDWSVIAVLRRGERPEVVAQWRDHEDHDLLARRAARIARYYNTALLVIESNTLETEAEDSAFVIEWLNRNYSNLYRRCSWDAARFVRQTRVGFHTNRSTKQSAVQTLVAAIRDHSYVERDETALNEYLSYERTQNGGYAAKVGFHDDVLMTRAMALYVLSTETYPALDPLSLAFFRR